MKADPLYEQLFGPPELVPGPGGRYVRNPAALERHAANAKAKAERDRIAAEEAAREREAEARRFAHAVPVGQLYASGDRATVSGFEMGRMLHRSSVTLPGATAQTWGQP